MPRPIVMVHGMWCTGAHYRRLAEILRDRGFDCHAPTLPAHETGVAHPQVGALGLKDYYAFLDDYIRAQNFAEPPVLMGHSMGGLLAQQLAARNPPFALVLLTTAAPAGINSIAGSNLMVFTPTLLKPGFWHKPQKIGRRQAARSLFNQTAPDTAARTYPTLVEESGRVVFELGLWWLDRSHANQVDCKAITCPVFVVSAGEDKLTPARMVRKVAARYPQAALRHYPERGHWVLDDRYTEEMGHDIASWLQAVERRVAARGQPGA